MGCCNKLHPPFGNAAGGKGLLLSADLVDHNYLGHVVFHCFDHYPVLPLRFCHLHAPGTTNRGMGHITITRNLIACVYYHHSFSKIIGQHPGDLS